MAASEGASQHGANTFPWIDLVTNASSGGTTPVGIRKGMLELLTKAGDAGVRVQDFALLDWRDEFTKDKLLRAMKLLFGDTGRKLQYQSRGGPEDAFRWRFKP